VDLMFQRFFTTRHTSACCRAGAGELQGSVIRRFTPVFMLFASGSLALVAAAERTLTFFLPDSIVLFGTTWLCALTVRSVSKIDVDDNLRSVTSSSGATKSTLLCVTATLAICLAVPAHGQVSIARPELLSGPWEVANVSGVDGILVMIVQGRANGLTRETVQVRVYHRKDGRGTKGWYVVSPPRDAAAQFDGRRLVVAGLTATFDPDTVRWTGDWIVDGHRRQVVLQRPRPAKGVSLNGLCGDWEGLPEAPPAPSVRIHIVQSSDGALTAWMDWGVVITERTQSQHYGRSMEVASADPQSIVLQNEAANYQTLGRFTGVLSSDGNTMTGQWNGRSALRTFRRIP
jgi:hypothetical protein